MPLQFVREFDRCVLAVLREVGTAQTMGALAARLCASNWDPLEITPEQLALALVRLEELGLVRNEICFLARDESVE